MMLELTSIKSNYSTIPPEYIDINHWNEWLRSGVNPDIIKLNVRSIHDGLQVDELLNRDNSYKYRRSHKLVPSWAVTGVNPETGEFTSAGVQVKPDTPYIGKDGKIKKYLGAMGYGAAPLFLDTGIDNFWLDVINDITKPIIITEGAKKAGAGLTVGHITVSIPGVSTCRKNGRLHQSIKLFAGFGRTFYLCFDNDITHKKPVKDAMLAMAKELSAEGSKVMVIILPPGELKGMDDFISYNGKDEFDKLVDEALTIEEWRKKLNEQWIERQSEDDDKEECKLKRQFDIVRDGWGDGLRLNKMTNIIELAGHPLDLDQLRLRIVLEFGEPIPLGDAQAIVQMLADQNAYHPVEDYLENVAQIYPDVDTSILDNLATRYFGSEEELHNIYMKKVLISAVARIKQPGCRLESVPILVNPRQGIGKSTFWRNLFGDDWFSDDLGDANEKDERMKLHNFWCLEWSEFENVYKKKDVSALKKFITTKTDSYRTPYSRTIKQYPRRSILVGTTNEQEILADPTGSRRFWVIPVKNRIPVEQLLEERDRIWAAAYALYKKGENWLLTSDQEERREELNKQFHVVDPWTERIQNYAAGRSEVTLQEMFDHLEIEITRQDVGTTRRIGSVFSRMGWDSERKRANGGWVRLWKKTTQDLQKKFENPCGSSGSSGSVFHDSVAAQTDTSTKTGEQTENCTKIYLDQSSQSQQGTQASDPDDPDRFSNFSEKQPALNISNLETNPIQAPRSSKKMIEIGGIYYSLSLGSKVKVNHVLPSVRKADVFKPKEFNNYRVKLLDLYPLPDDKWKLNIGYLADYAGEVCAIVGYDSKKKEYQLETKSGSFQYAKANALKKPQIE